MSIKFLSRCLGLGLCWAILLVVIGCGKSATTDPTQQAKAFQSATPQNQADWSRALEATRTNDFALAILTFRKLQGQTDLTPEQRAALTDRMATANEQLAAAVQKGDSNAVKALEEIRAHWRMQ